ncbi:hypothetical protein HDV05_008393, partial [Chytridiales sp. JEL 0842]
MLCKRNYGKGKKCMKPAIDGQWCKNHQKRVKNFNDKKLQSAKDGEACYHPSCRRLFKGEPYNNAKNNDKYNGTAVQTAANLRAHERKKMKIGGLPEVVRPHFKSIALKAPFIRNAVSE